MTLKYSTKPLATSLTATSFDGFDDLEDFLYAMYESMMSCTEIFAGMSRSLCCRVTASQSSTRHGLSSSGILILTSTFERNCSSLSTDASIRCRFFLFESKSVPDETSGVCVAGVLAAPAAEGVVALLLVTEVADAVVGVLAVVLEATVVAEAGAADGLERPLRLDVDGAASGVETSLDGVEALDSLPSFGVQVPELLLTAPLLSFFFPFGVPFLFLPADEECCLDTSFCLCTFASLYLSTRFSGTHSSQFLFHPA